MTFPSSDLAARDASGNPLNCNRHCVVWLDAQDLELANQVAAARCDNHFNHERPKPFNRSTHRPPLTELELSIVGAVGEIALRRLFLAPVDLEHLVVRHGDGGVDLRVEERELGCKTTHYSEGKLITHRDQPIVNTSFLCQTSGWNVPEPPVLVVGWIRPEEFYQHAGPLPRVEGVIGVHRSLLRPVGDALSRVRHHAPLSRCSSCRLLVAGSDDWCGAKGCRRAAA